MKIPGIGDYTSSAIASIAFSLPEIAIDGNVKRVMARYLNYTENVNTRACHKYFETFLKEELLLNGADPSDFTQASYGAWEPLYVHQVTQTAKVALLKKCALAIVVSVSEQYHLFLKQNRYPFMKNQF